MMRYYKVALLAAISVILTPAIELWAADVPDEWKRLVEARKIEAQSVSSIEAQFDFKMHYLGPRGVPADLSKKVSFGKQDGKSYESETITRPNGQSLAIQMTYDGIVARRRHPTIRGVLILSSDPDDRKFATPTPAEIIEYFSPDEVDDVAKKGEVKIAYKGFEEIGGARCAKFTFTDKDQQYQVWYDEQRGFWPLRTRRVSSTGQLMGEISGVSLTKVTSDGNEFFYPVSGDSKALDENGNVALEWSFRVDPTSIRINQDIPASKFFLEARPDEVVFDKSSGINLVDPHKVADLDDVQAPVPAASASEPNSVPLPSSPVAVQSTQSPIEDKDLKRWEYLIGAVVMVGISLLLWLPKKNKSRNG